MSAHCWAKSTEALPVEQWNWDDLQACEVIAEVKAGGKTFDELRRSIATRLRATKEKGAAEARKKR